MEEWSIKMVPIKVLRVEGKSADNTDSIFGPPSCSCLCNDLPPGVRWLMYALTRMQEALLWSSLKWCTEGPTAVNYPVTSSPCPSLYKSWRWESGLGWEAVENSDNYPKYTLNTTLCKQYGVPCLFYFFIFCLQVPSQAVGYITLPPPSPVSPFVQRIRASTWQGKHL